jgi:hypothetical protein
LTSRRAAVLVVTAAATLALAPAAPAAALGVEASFPAEVAAAVPKGAVPKVAAAVKTPVVEVAVEVSDRGVAASVTAPPAPAGPSEPAAPSKPRAGSGSERKSTETRTPRRDAATRTATALAVEPPVAPPAGLTGTSRPEPSRGAAPRPSAPEPATASADGPRALADAVGSAGTTAALAALFVLAVAFASWIAPLAAGTVVSPLLSFALQRPG